MRAANITAALVILLWSWLALRGRRILEKFLVDDVPDWPTMVSIDSAILLPMSMATGLMTFAWFCNAFGRWPLALGIASFACLVAVLPYLAISGGGV